MSESSVFLVSLLFAAVQNRSLLTFNSSHNYVDDCFNYDLYFHHYLQFVLLMDPPSMRVEWKCITMVNGVQCVMMDGI